MCIGNTGIIPLSVGSLSSLQLLFCGVLRFGSPKWKLFHYKKFEACSALCMFPFYYESIQVCILHRVSSVHCDVMRGRRIRVNVTRVLFNINEIKINYTFVFVVTLLSGGCAVHAGERRCRAESGERERDKSIVN